MSYSFTTTPPNQQEAEAQLRQLSGVQDADATNWSYTWMHDPILYVCIYAPTNVYPDRNNYPECIYAYFYNAFSPTSDYPDGIPVKDLVMTFDPDDDTGMWEFQMRDPQTCNWTSNMISDRIGTLNHNQPQCRSYTARYTENHPGHPQESQSFHNWLNPAPEYRVAYDGLLYRKVEQNVQPRLGT